MCIRDRIDLITELVFKVNAVLIDYFAKADIELIDFKVEFGRYKGEIILADEISPDTCRLWDAKTHEKLDKDQMCIRDSTSSSRDRNRTEYGNRL